MEHFLHVAAGAQPELIDGELERVSACAANAGTDYKFGHVSNLQSIESTMLPICI